MKLLSESLYRKNIVGSNFITIFLKETSNASENLKIFYFSVKVIVKVYNFVPAFSEALQPVSFPGEIGSGQKNKSFTWPKIKLFAEKPKNFAEGYRKNTNLDTPKRKWLFWRSNLDQFS